MAIVALKLTNPKTDDVKNLQDSVNNSINSIINRPILDGKLIEDVELTTSATLVSHGLRKVPRGYVVVKKNAAATVYEASPSQYPNLFLNLTASASVKVSLWVF